MPRPNAWTITLAIGLAWGGVAAAHDGHENEPGDAPQFLRTLRTWTHASGRFQVRGSFVAQHGDQVQIRREHGERLDLKLQALSVPDRAWVDARRAEIAQLNDGATPWLLARRDDGPAGREPPPIYQAFRPFADTLKLRWDDEAFFVESNGLPDHRMMVGIRAWQQQVPLPQPYTGANAWRIPLHPVPARRPMSAKENFFRGAIALAVNGVPIFNPIKNDGRTDTYLAGELDEYGGHCGRADDYHYHIAPVHLAAKVGDGKPLAYALDGYPIYGYDEPDGSKATKLDRFNGHETPRTPYHYHATKAYPYLNGGFHGEVVERGGQVDPQPQASPVREALTPLRGARITDFTSPGPNRYSLTYEIQGRKHFVHYALEPGGAIVFRFVDDQGRTTPETYRRREGPPGPPPRGVPPGGGRGRPARKNADRAPRGEARRVPAITSTVAEVLTTPDGEVEGLRLDDGNEVRIRPGEGGQALRGVVAVKDRVTINGWKEPGESEIHAAMIIHLATGKVIQVDRLPPELDEVNERPRPERPAPATPGPETTRAPGGFILSSPVVKEGGRLPREFTGDGAGISPPLTWSGAPAGTRSYALIMHHEAPDGVKWYWVLHDLPPDLTSLPKGVTGVGKVGSNGINRRVGYAPPHSKGPGDKRYTLTLYALSATPRVDMPAARVSRDVLLDAMKGLVLGTAELNVVSAREGAQGDPPPPRPGSRGAQRKGGRS
ncbi:MAG: YHYH protein [Isosphaeraceae bacterium]